MKIKFDSTLLQLSINIFAGIFYAGFERTLFITHENDKEFAKLGLFSKYIMTRCERQCD